MLIKNSIQFKFYIIRSARQKRSDSKKILNLFFFLIFNFPFFSLKVTYILSEPSPSWTGQTGHITLDIIKTFIDPSSTNVATFGCVCGPQPFNELALEFLEGAGFQSSDLHIFHG